MLWRLPRARRFAGRPSSAANWGSHDRPAQNPPQFRCQPGLPVPSGQSPAQAPKGSLAAGPKERHSVTTLTVVNGRAVSTTTVAVLVGAKAVARSGHSRPTPGSPLSCRKSKPAAFQWWRAFQAGIPLLPAAKLMSAKLGEFSFACERCRYHGGAPGAHARVVGVEHPLPAQRPSHCPSSLRVAAMSRTRTWSFQVNSVGRAAVGSAAISQRQQQ